jgi:uncharacterized BrkB/YihY/UPF0761 family membrane protein
MEEDKNIREKRLSSKIENLTKEIHKQNSFWRNFIGGIIKGIGYAIGATILFGIIITIVGYIVRTSDAQWLQEIADWIKLNQYID